MTDDEGVLSRWSRLKRAANRPAPEPKPPAPAPRPEDAREEESPPPPPLPPLDSLDGDSDYTPFLAEGVPAELKRLALRRAWASDPKIAGFRGFAEYDWDCNAPGYGALRATDDIARLLDSLNHPAEKPPAEETPVATAPEAPIGSAPEAPMGSAPEAPMGSAPEAALEEARQEAPEPEDGGEAPKNA